MCLSLEEISFESNSSLIEIGSSAFSFNISLESVELPSSVEVIGAYAFSKCLSLNFVSFETNSVLSVIGPSSFEYVPIGNISFPDSVSTIGEYAFIGTSVSGDVVLPASLQNYGYGVFASCSSLESLSIDESNVYYCTVSGVLYNEEKTILVQ